MNRVHKNNSRRPESRLRSAREAAGLSRSALSRTCGLDASRIYQLERGQGWPKPATARTLAKALNVEVGDLFPIEDWAADERS